MITYHVLNNSIVVSFADKVFTISKSDNKYQMVLECVTSGALDSIPSVVDTAAAYAKAGIEIRDGMIYLNGISLDSIIPKG
jgi:hypothetical protein